MIILAYNYLSDFGEIYNFLEIRKNLESKGINFSTNSDTEVLIKAWAQSGPKCLQSFDGMFAFTLFDGKKTHLATDPFGEKPLYVYTCVLSVAFSLQILSHT